jgi:Fe-Mn family superoxide dismutase
MNLAEHYMFKNRPLPYAYDALEPYVSALTMRLHHEKLLQGYIDRLNAALRDYPMLQDLTLEQLIRTAPRLPHALRIPVERNAGGVYNHRFYFEQMSPDAVNSPFGRLAEAIQRDFGNLQNFKGEFGAAALSVFGSGYAWLVADRNGGLKIITTANQETPLNLGLCPVINIDVWEHAYYLQYFTQRDNYINEWFKVLDWKRAGERYFDCFSKRY